MPPRTQFLAQNFDHEKINLTDIVQRKYPSINLFIIVCYTEKALKHEITYFYVELWLNFLQDNI